MRKIIAAVALVTLGLFACQQSEPVGQNLPNQTTIESEPDQGILVTNKSGATQSHPRGDGSDGVNYNQLNNVFNIKDYGAKGDGSTDDRAAIQAAIDATINAKGKLIIPAPSDYYRINGTLFFQPKKANQAFYEVEGQGHWGFQIVYQGPSGQPAAVVIGMKSGSFRNVKIKIGDGVTNSVAWDIGTQGEAGSTSAFTFYDCMAELNRGSGNQGFRLGHIEGGGADISQILFSNCTVWGWSAGVDKGVQKHYPGQIAWNITGHNTLQLTWVGGSTSFVETGIKLEQGGSMFFFGFGASQTGTDFYMAYANNISVYGGRFEAGKKFLVMEQMAAHPIFTVRDAMIEEYRPEDGIMFHAKSPGTLFLESVAINRLNEDYDSRMFTLSTPLSKPYGTFSIRGGKINASDPFITSSGWRVKVDNVVKVTANNLQSMGYFNTIGFPSQNNEPELSTIPVILIVAGAIILIIFLAIIIILIIRKRAERA